MNTHIRFATSQDAHEIAICHVAAWQKIYKGYIADSILNSLSVEERMTKWHKLILKNVKILVIEHEQSVKGFASYSPSRDADTNINQCGEITAIYLHPDIWFQGMGKKICLAVFAALQEMGFNEVIVWTLRENQQARNFYTKMGFKETSVTKIEYINQIIPIHEVRYHKLFNL